MSKIKMELKLDLILNLSNIELDEEGMENFEETIKLQTLAQESLENFCKENNMDLVICEWEGMTSINNGYEELLSFKIVTDNDEFKYEEEFEILKQDIECCTSINVNNVSIVNYDDILNEVKEKILNEEMTIKEMENIVEDILEYDDEAKIVDASCPKLNTYSYSFYPLGNWSNSEEFILSIDWEVIQLESEDDNIYSRIIKVTNVEVL